MDSKLRSDLGSEFTHRRSGAFLSPQPYHTSANPRSCPIDMTATDQTCVLRAYTESPQTIVRSVGSQNSVWSTESPCSGPRSTISESTLPSRTKRLWWNGIGFVGFSGTFSSTTAFSAGCYGTHCAKQRAYFQRQ